MSPYNFTFEVKCFEIKPSIFLPHPPFHPPFPLHFLLFLYSPVVLGVFSWNGIEWYARWQAGYCGNIAFSTMVCTCWQSDWPTKNGRLVSSTPSLLPSPLLEWVVNTCGSDEIHSIAWNTIYFAPCWRQMNTQGLAIKCVKFHCTH